MRRNSRFLHECREKLTSSNTAESGHLRKGMAVALPQDDLGSSFGISRRKEGRADDLLPQHSGECAKETRKVQLVVLGTSSAQRLTGSLEKRPGSLSPFLTPKKTDHRQPPDRQTCESFQR
jgi:hypothetical protein